MVSDFDNKFIALINQICYYFELFFPLIHHVLLKKVKNYNSITQTNDDILNLRDEVLHLYSVSNNINAFHPLHMHYKNHSFNSEFIEKR